VVIKVFFCSSPKGSVTRTYMSLLCEHRWLEEPGVELIKLTPGDCDVSRVKFQRERRIVANREGGDHYVVADDDCLLPSGQTLEIAKEILEQHPRFAVISYSLSNHSLGSWTSVPKEYGLYEDYDVVEHAAAGGIRVCRNVDFAWPPMRPHGRYDGIHAEALRREGYRTGYFKHLYCNHIGEGYGSIV